MALFASVYQGGDFVEVLSAHGSNPLAHWRTTGPPKAIQKAFDKALKGCVFTMQAGMRIQGPKDEKKQILGLSQPNLMLQICVGQVRRHACGGNRRP
jgi:hypothetical protein